MKKLLSLMAVFVISILAISLASAALTGLTVTKVEVNNEEFLPGVTGGLLEAADLETAAVDDQIGLVVEEGETLDIEVGLEASADTDEVQIEAELRGYDNDLESLQDETGTFNMNVHGADFGTGVSRRTVSLSMDLPKDLEEDRYLLRLRVTDRDHADVTKYVVLQVEPVREGLDIADVSFSPGNTVKAGRSLLASVLLENFGQRDEDNVKVTVEIPGLGVKATEYVDEVKVEDQDNGGHDLGFEDVAEMFLPIPADAAEGDYEVKVTVQFDNLRDTVTKSYTLHVKANEAYLPGKLVLAVGPESQSVAAGQTAVYGVALSNAGSTSKAYVLESVTGDWATATLSDSLVVLEPGQNKVVYVNVAVSPSATAGEHLASLIVKSGSDVLETVALKANVVASAVPVDGISLRNGLEIALIVLVVLLVVIGLIVGFSRLRKDEEGEDKTYY